jgi:uncharacterized protein YdhG (YjbR/CyaY superfamily)
MSVPATIDEYIAALTGERRAVMEELRGTIAAAAPDAIESIAYQMPALRGRDGRFVVSYAAFRNHYSIFPASDGVVEALGDEIRPYLAGKGTIRFPANAAIPLSLVSRIVTVRLAETATRDSSA